MHKSILVRLKPCFVFFCHILCLLISLTELPLSRWSNTIGSVDLSGTAVKVDSAEDNGVLDDLFFLVKHVAEVDLCLGLLNFYRTTLL